ncbi:hypothetical protein ACFW16_32735 [Inquilinus sp. NPDC058860]|uniref:hypothetical protein n=1 Tax=Inquilinus sp. NPDC058860 TaxID=3346652 RepID=UPI0036748276
MDVRETIAEIARRVQKNPETIGVLSTGEACAAALLLNRLDLLSDAYKHPLDALDRLGSTWEAAVRELHQNGW